MTGVGMSVKTPRRTQADRSGATRAALLDACARLLAAAGYAATTTSAIAAEAALSRGALQYSFKSRTDLMLAVTGEGYQRLVGDLRSGHTTAGTTAERVQAHIDTMLSAYRSPYALAAYEVLLGERGNPEFIARHADLIRSAEAELDQLWLQTFAGSGATQAAILTARRVARAAVLGLAARSLPLGSDTTTAAAIAPAITALLDPNVAKQRSRETLV
jgi:AcrR family transcriptional regulator